MNVYFRTRRQRVFGTCPLRGDDLRAAVEAAAGIGYRAFDTAQMYGNEPELGEALQATGIPRGDMLVTTKVHPDNFREDRFVASVEESLKALRVERIDVLLLHWPPVGGDVAPSLRLLEDCLGRGLADNVGVSNYTAAMMRDAVAIVDAPIATNQVEFHPLLDRRKVLAAATETGITLSSHCSLARGAVFRCPELAEIGAAYGRTAGQAALRWALQKGVSVNTMATEPAYMRENFDVVDFTLSHVDMARIDALSATGLRIVDLDQNPWAPEWD